MNKNEFLKKLRRALHGLPPDEIEERISFYSEMIDDRVEDGLSVEEAIKEIGTVEEIRDQIIAETPLKKLLKEKFKVGRKLAVWEIVLLILGSPIWASILITVFSVLFTVFCTVYSLLLALWATDLSIAVYSVVSLFVLFPIFLFGGRTATAFAMLGFAFLCAGIAIFAFFGCKALTRLLFKLTKWLFIKVKSLFIKKGEAR